MKNNETQRLKESIRIMQMKQSMELSLLKEQAYLTHENIKPINLIKSAFKKSSDSPEVHSSLMHDAIGLTTGYLSKKFMLGSSKSPVKKILGTLLQLTVGNLVANNTDTILSTAGYLVNRIGEFRSKQKQSHQNNMIQK